MQKSNRGFGAAWREVTCAVWLLSRGIGRGVRRVYKKQKEQEVKKWGKAKRDQMPMACRFERRFDADADADAMQYNAEDVEGRKEQRRIACAAMRCHAMPCDAMQNNIRASARINRKTETQSERKVKTPGNAAC
ncbi:uncharacterized protein K452DRAFT_286368 [Aplosporella prunicola CBS 121167]|uniref:Uncharacterized protein n=1 Tax=Aplosporella prunicola CBS 121167 TaxID=1176127 RepID=A0A6A6BHC9_9PEZI|nr:uncharacterized protein K452DRAFT_286368 [Aplosporella prunicola CBS 121167]KAF2142735.1 hypothetical protein K452DRAFT_286368 [Aplosporella prunicola CBS 121167]